jgi:hypothetical protein
MAGGGQAPSGRAAGRGRLRKMRRRALGWFRRGDQMGRKQGRAVGRYRGVASMLRVGLWVARSVGTVAARSMFGRRRQCGVDLQIMRDDNT